MEMWAFLLFLLGMAAFVAGVMETEVWFERALLLLASVVLTFPGLLVVFKWALLA